MVKAIYFLGLPNQMDLKLQKVKNSLDCRSKRMLGLSKQLIVGSAKSNGSVELLKQ